MKNAVKSDLFRHLPSIDEVLRRPGVSAKTQIHGTAAVTDAARAVLARLRSEVASGCLDAAALTLAVKEIESAMDRQLQKALSYSLRSVINATGVVLHTNLGRAPLPEAAIQHISESAGLYSNLEFDLEEGVRGKRDVHAARLLKQLLDVSVDINRAASGADEPNALAQLSTIVVNNNAAAVLLALNTLADGGEVIVSRGELVEIGGSFRIPDVMAKSGATLKEVGTTNRTRRADYASAINDRTKLLLRVHRSNFEITGFTEQATTSELVELARERGLPLMEDLGSGALVDLQNFGIDGEPSVPGSLRAGVDIVTYSGDKLLGGPQAGLISGRSDLVARMRQNSLFRALRVDKLTYAALEATLLAYARRDHDAIPVLRMMRLTQQEIGRRAGKVAEQVHAAGRPGEKVKIEIWDGESVIGGGAAPSSVLPTRLLAVSCADMSADELAARLRRSDPPIIGRVEEGRVLLDLRTVFKEQDAEIAAALARIEH